MMKHHWHRARHHLQEVVLLPVDARIVLYSLVRGTAHTPISTDIALPRDPARRDICSQREKYIAEVSAL